MSVIKRVTMASCIGLIAPLAACGSSESGPSRGVPDATIIVGATRTFATLDPAQAYDEGSWTLYDNIYQSLLTYSPGGNTPEPDAAQSCQFTDTADLTYECTLRSHMRFSNGDPLNAAAVKYSIDRVININDAAGPAVILNSIKTIEAQGDTRVIFHLKSPDATLPGRLSSPAAAIIDPKYFPATKELSSHFTRIVGSGRYKIDSVSFTGSGSAETASEVKLSLNPNYVGAAQAPQNSQVDIKYFSSIESDKAALDNHSVDLVVHDLSADDVTAIQENERLDGGLQAFSAPGNEIRLLSLNTRRGPFSNVTIRRAVADLIYRSAVALSAYRYTVSPAYTIVPTSITDASNSFATVYGREPQSYSAVRKQLRQAGVQLPVSFTLSSYDGNGNKDKEIELSMIKGQLEASGLFKVKLRPFSDFSHMQSAILQSGRFDAFAASWFGDYLDPDDYITPLIGGASNALFNGYQNSKIDVQLNQGLRSRRREDAGSTYRGIQDSIARDAPVIPLWEGSQFAVTQSNLIGMPLMLDSSGIMRWWMIGKS